MRTARSSGRPGGGGVSTRHPPGPGTPAVNRMADRCKNITLPQTSFAGGKKRTKKKETRKKTRAFTVFFGGQSLCGITYGGKHLSEVRPVPTGRMPAQSHQISAEGINVIGLLSVMQKN